MEEQAPKEFVSDGVVLGHKMVQTKDAKWLCIDNVYQKFHRSNFYDIGGTYIEDLADYWFLFKVETVGNIFLMHLIVNNRNDGSFNVSVSYNNEIKLDKKSPIAHLPTHLRKYQFVNCKEMSQNYLATYSFSDLDVESLIHRKLLIGVSFTHTEEIKGVRQEIINKVKINHDFSALLSDPICSDFVIETADGEKFNVHKVLLIAHSEVFKAMLKEDTAESMNNYVKLPDVSSEDLKGILEFIYTGTIKELDNVNLFNLLMLADQYNLDGLRELAQYTLTQQLNTENALDVLIVADMYNSDTLKLATLKFIKKNVRTLKSNTFKEMKNADLVRELCQYVAPLH